MIFLHFCTLQVLGPFYEYVEDKVPGAKGVSLVPDDNKYNIDDLVGDSADDGDDDDDDEPGDIGKKLIISIIEVSMIT